MDTNTMIVLGALAVLALAVVVAMGARLGYVRLPFGIFGDLEIKSDQRTTVRDNRLTGKRHKIRARGGGAEVVKNRLHGEDHSIDVRP